MKKLLLGLTAAAMLGAGAGAATKAALPQNNIVSVSAAAHSPSSRLESSCEELDWLSQAILDKGVDFMKSGISSLATYAFKTACMEMGIDVRDATTKKIDQILAQLNQISKQIAQGFDDLTKKTQQVQDSNIMSKVLERLNEVRSPILVEMSTLEDIAKKEDDPTYDKEFLARQKETFIDGFKTKLNFYGLSNVLWHSTEMLALQLTNPNEIKRTQSLMDLYDNTLGANDIWDYQSYAPRIHFVQECTFLINSLALLAKLDAAKEISGYEPGDSNIDGVKKGISQMCTAVNAFNSVFQKELEKLEAIRQRHDDDEKPTMSHLKRTFDSDGFVHVSTDYTVSAYLATVTVDNVAWKNTVADCYNDSYSHCFKTFRADESFQQTILTDYTFYVNNYEVEEGYNLKNYLVDVGFRIPKGKEGEFEEAIGIYKNIDVSHIDRGVFRGTDHYAYYNYYDWSGSHASKDYCRVGETFWRHYDDEQIYQDNLNKKMVAFIDQNNTELYGSTYWTIAQRVNKSTSELIDHFYRGNSYNDGDTAKYDIHK